jgi:thiol:disulfide interchange protein DsbA
MTGIIRTLGLSLFALLFAAQASAQSFEEGRHYVELDVPVRTASDTGVEVAEVFWYGCPHCYEFKPLIESWAEDLPDHVNYVKVPAALGQSWEPHAKAFYAVEAMGELDKVHDAFFEALAVERQQLNSGEALADFVEEYGVDGEEFLKNYNSFGVNARMQQAQSKIRGARVTGTPSVIVAGKYRVTASMAGSHEAVLDVVDYLVEQER